MKILAILTILLLLAITFAAADEINDCPGKTRTIQGRAWLVKGDSWTSERPLPGIKIEIDSSCGNFYEDVVTDRDGEFTVEVQGPVHVGMKEGQPYFGSPHYLHNMNNNADLRLKEGKEVFVNVLNSRFRKFPKSKNLLECEDGEVYHSWHPQIYLEPEMGKCTLTAHDGVNAYQREVSLDSVGKSIDIKLDKKVEKITMPKLEPKPTETVFKIHKGWNLIPLALIGNARTTCFYNDEKPFKFIYDPIERRYISDIEDYYEEKIEKDKDFLERNKEKLFNALGLGSMWFVSSTDCEMMGEIEEFPNDVKRRWYHGWNFRYVDDLLVGSTLGDAGKSCILEKAYKFDSENQKWEKITSREPLDEYGMGFIVKVASDCTISSFRQSFIPPVLPE